MIDRNRFEFEIDAFRVQITFFRENEQKISFFITQKGLEIFYSDSCKQGVGLLLIATRLCCGEANYALRTFQEAKSFFLNKAQVLKSILSF